MTCRLRHHQVACSVERYAIGLVQSSRGAGGIIRATRRTRAGQGGYRSPGNLSHLVIPIVGYIDGVSVCTYDHLDRSIEPGSTDSRTFRGTWTGGSSCNRRHGARRGRTTGTDKFNPAYQMVASVRHIQIVGTGAGGIIKKDAFRQVELSGSRCRIVCRSGRTGTGKSRNRIRRTEADPPDHIVLLVGHIKTRAVRMDGDICRIIETGSRSVPVLQPSKKERLKTVSGNGCCHSGRRDLPDPMTEAISHIQIPGGIDRDAGRPPELR